MQAVVSSQLNLVGTIFKPENDHLWHLKFAKYFFEKMEKLCRWGMRQEAQVTVNRVKGKEN